MVVRTLQDSLRDFCWCRCFCHRTDSDLFLFVFSGQLLPTYQIPMCKYYNEFTKKWAAPLPMCSPLFVFVNSCHDSAHICPIRTGISTHEHWGNVFILLFVWLVVMGVRQNYFHISPNFGDFEAKMSFFRYIINQKRKIFIKHCSPRVPKHHLYLRCVSI